MTTVGGTELSLSPSRCWPSIAVSSSKTILTSCCAGETVRSWATPSAFFSTCSRKDRKSTRLNSSHLVISYAVFCLKKKNIQTNTQRDNHILHIIQLISH